MEEFGTEGSGQLIVTTTRDSHGKPVGALLRFPATLSEEMKKPAVSINSKCFVKRGGCNTAEELLPTLDELKQVRR